MPPDAIACIRATRVVVACASLLASSVAYAEPTIDVQGLCPAVTITLEGATPLREVMLVTGGFIGTTTLERGPCAGTTLGLAGADRRRNHLVTTRTDASGSLTFTSASVGHDACAEGVQGLDLTTCEVTPALPMTIDCSSLEDGLVAYWPGDGDPSDVVGTHVESIEGTVDYAPGVFGDAFEFDGRSAVRVRPADDLEYDEGEPFTYAMWIYNEGTSLPSHLFGKRHTCTGGGLFDYQFVVGHDGTTHFGPDDCAAFISGGPPSRTWQHVVATYDGTAFLLYLDGELASTSGRCVGNVMRNLGAELKIGSSGTCAGWVGLVDEVMLWSRTLTDDEVACLSGAGFHPE